MGFYPWPAPLPLPHKSFDASLVLGSFGFALVCVSLSPSFITHHYAPGALSELWREGGLRLRTASLSSETAAVAADAAPVVADAPVAAICAPTLLSWMDGAMWLGLDCFPLHAISNDCRCRTLLQLVEGDFGVYGCAGGTD